MSAKPDVERFTPRYPTLLALGILTVFVLLLCLPMFSGQFLGGGHSDQTWTGVAFRSFWQQEFQRTGHVPLWNPYMFGGMPFIGAMHGDMFYPTSFLRIFFQAHTVLNITFALHLVLAGVFTYLFLRVIGTSWLAAVTGGLAYQLSGIVASQVSPGHDGKMIVSALFPLLLTGLVLGIKRRRMEGYALVALVVGLDILSPQLQMAQYSLIAAGLLTLYLCFMDEERPATAKDRVVALGLATVAVALGFTLSLVQILPFVHNSPYSARVAGNQGWLYATSYAMPLENIVDWLVPTFTGSSLTDTHWGSNGVKLHSEYVGAATLALALVGIMGPERRKLKLFLGGIGLLFVLVALGGHTPFYRLWYAIVPGVKVTRAAGMAFFIPTFVFCCWAAFGVERLERGEVGKLLTGLLIAAGLLLLLGASGGLTAVAEVFAGDRYPYVERNAGPIALGSSLSALVVAAVAGLGLAVRSARLRAPAFAGLLILLVAADLFLNARRSFSWTPSATLYADDEILRHLQAVPAPWRVLDFTDTQSGTYPTAYLMGKRVANALGHHGNELHSYDELMGGKNSWKDPSAGDFTLSSARLWNLLAIRFVILPMEAQFPGFRIVARTAQAAPAGGAGYLYEADTIPPYARVIGAAVKTDESRMVPTLLDPRWDYNRVVLLPEDAPVNPPQLTAMPPAVAARAAVTAWAPGEMTIRLDPAPEQDGYVVVSENWYPDWRATVDGQQAQVLRGQRSLITIPVARGARDIQLRMVSPSYQQGKAISLITLAAIGLWFVLPLARRRKTGG